MTLQQLIEMAILDAMGLLDEQERDEFESSFRAASAPIQAQVRREQTRLSRIEALLPDVAAPAGLRAAVLEAVRQQMALGLSTDEPAELIVPPFIQSRGVSRLWRAAAVGLAAAAVVLGVTTFRFASQSMALSENVRADEDIKYLNKEFGASYVRRVLFDQDLRRVVMHPAVDGFKGQASIWIHPELKGDKFFYQGPSVPDGKVYRLAVVDENDKVVETLAVFNPKGGIQPVDVAQMPRGQAHLAIIGPASSSSDAETVLSRGDLPGPTL